MGLYTSSGGMYELVKSLSSCNGQLLFLGATVIAGVSSPRDNGSRSTSGDSQVSVN